MEPQNILRKYIESILKLQEENKNAPLNLEELNQLHMELGLTHDDLNFIDQRFSDVYQRGLGFVRYQDWDRAIAELEQAITIKPLHIEVLYHLAEAYQQRSVRTHKRSDKQKALYYAECCLRVDPKNERALYLITTLRRNLHSRRKQQGYFRFVLMGLGVLIVGLGGYLIWDEFRKKPVEPNVPPPRQEIPVPSKTQTIPISIVPSPGAKGFILSTESSFLDKEASRPTYQFKGSLIHPDDDLRKLVLVLRLVSADGQKTVLDEVRIPALSEDDEELWAGDALPVSRVFSGLKNVGEFVAELVIAEVKKEPHHPDDKDQQTLRANAEGIENRGLLPRLTERYQTIVPKPDFFSHELVLTCTNTAKVPVYAFQAEVRWYDQQRRQVFSVPVEFVRQGAPALLPGQRRRLKIHQQIPVNVDAFLEYDITVVLLE